MLKGEARRGGRKEEGEERSGRGREEREGRKEGENVAQNERMSLGDAEGLRKVLLQRRWWVVSGGSDGESTGLGTGGPR